MIDPETREKALQMALMTAAPGEPYHHILERARAFADYMRPKATEKNGAEYQAFVAGFLGEKPRDD